MSYIGKNIKEIRTAKNLSQAAFAQLFNLARPSVGAYEEGRSEPKIETLLHIAQHFGISVDLLLTKELTINELYGFDIFKNGLSKGESLKKIAGTGVVSAQQIFIPLISVNMAENYIKNLQDRTFVAGLPTISIPVKESTADYRAFEISQQIGKQSEMKQGDILICTSFDKESKSIKPDQLYVVITKQGIVIEDSIQKNESNNLNLKTNKPGSPQFGILSEQVLEIWEAQAIINFMPLLPATPEDKLATLETKLQQLLERVEKLEN